MKTIILNIEDNAYAELKSVINFKKMTGQDYTLDCQFIFMILYGI